METVYTVQELAGKLKVTPETIYKALRTGKLKGETVFSKWQIPQSAVDEYLAASNEKSNRRGRKRTSGERQVLITLPSELYSTIEENARLAHQSMPEYIVKTLQFSRL